MLHNINHAVPTPVNTALQPFSQSVSHGLKDCQRRHFLVSKNVEIPGSDKGGLLEAEIARNFEWFEYNEGCLK